MEENPPIKQSITVSRTFRKTVDSLEQLQEAISSYTAKAAEKLRQQKLAANSMSVFVNTNRFNDNRYFNSYTFGFDVATSDTIEMLKVSNDGIKRIFKEGKDFKKCGIILHNLVSEDNIQGSLFSVKDRQKSKRLMQTIDLINSKSASPLIYAAEGINQEWKTKFNNRSKSYTTRWDEIPKVK